MEGEDMTNETKKVEKVVLKAKGKFPTLPV